MIQLIGVKMAFINIKLSYLRNMNKTSGERKEKKNRISINIVEHCSHINPRETEAYIYIYISHPLFWCLCIVWEVQRFFKSPSIRFVLKETNTQSRCAFVSLVVCYCGDLSDTLWQPNHIFCAWVAYVTLCLTWNEIIIFFFVRVYKRCQLFSVPDNMRP
jgi:hypothetical protein